MTIRSRLSDLFLDLSIRLEPPRPPPQPEPPRFIHNHTAVLNQQATSALLRKFADQVDSGDLAGCRLVLHWNGVPCVAYTTVTSMPSAGDA